MSIIIIILVNVYIVCILLITKSSEQISIYERKGTKMKNVYKINKEKLSFLFFVCDMFQYKFSMENVHSIVLFD